jgi:hypothetical protein
MAIGVTLTYEQQVHYIAEAIDDDFNGVRGVAVASAAYALSLAHSKGVADVTADIKAEMAAQKVKK